MRQATILILALFCTSATWAATTPEVSIAVTDGVSGELDVDTGEFEVTRSGNTTGDLVVNLNVRGIAKNSIDYATVASTLTILDGQATAKILITPLVDTVDEGPEGVTVTVLAGTGYTLAADKSANLSIQDERFFMGEPESTFAVSGTASGGTAMIGIVGDLEPGLSITTQAGENPAQIATKLVAAHDADPTASPFSEMILSDDGQGIVLSGTSSSEVFLQTTDAGLGTAGTVTNLTAVSSKAQETVTLSWSLPATTPDEIFIYRSNVPVASLDGTATSFVDNDFDEEEDDAPASVVSYVVVTQTTIPDSDVSRFTSELVRVATESILAMPDDTFAITTTTSNISNAVKNKPYAQALFKNAGKNPVVWSLDGGGLPLGLSLRAATYKEFVQNGTSTSAIELRGTEGVLEGTPTSSGTFNFTLKVTDADGSSVTKALAITVTELPALDE